MSDESSRKPTEESREASGDEDDKAKASGSGSSPSGEPDASEKSVRPKVPKEKEAEVIPEQKDEEPSKPETEGLLDTIGHLENLTMVAEAWTPTEDKDSSKNIRHIFFRRKEDVTKTQEHRANDLERQFRKLAEIFTRPRKSNSPEVPYEEISSDSPRDQDEASSVAGGGPATFRDRGAQPTTSPKIPFHSNPKSNDEGGLPPPFPIRVLLVRDPSEGGKLGSPMQRSRSTGDKPKSPKTKKLGQSTVPVGVYRSLPQETAQTQLTPPTLRRNNRVSSSSNADCSARSSAATFGSESISVDSNPSPPVAPPPAKLPDEQSKEAAITPSEHEEDNHANLWEQIRTEVARFLQRMGMGPVLERGQEVMQYIVRHGEQLWIVVCNRLGGDVHWFHCGCCEPRTGEQQEEVDSCSSTSATTQWNCRRVRFICDKVEATPLVPRRDYGGEREPERSVPEPGVSKPEPEGSDPEPAEQPEGEEEKLRSKKND